ncbi:hypothetical protein HYU17_05940 [Candidatus Woesearchaeota archaeon]|nr:hypothetical protein [Candidatus Woesearchaeota archaeon]
MDLLENLANPEKFFYCADGSVLRSIRELGQKLETMSSQAFGSHANSHKNDFHNWVRDVFQDNELAGELLQARTPQQAAAAVRRRMQKLLQAREEIETAIRKATKENAPVTAAKKFRLTGVAAPKIKRKTAKAENRKLNKKKNKKQPNKAFSVKRAGKKRRTMKNRRKSSKTRPKKQLKAQLRNRMKKHVSNWLKWLSISPKM